MAGTATLMALKADSEARASEARAATDRSKALLVICLDHLVENGYVESAAALEREAGAPISKLEVADNIDLTTIVKEFEAYYELKLGKKPKLVRKVNLPRLILSDSVQNKG